MTQTTDTHQVTHLESLTGYTVLDRPLWWHRQGLSETASGYGRRLRSRYCVRTDDGRIRRIYITQYSNSGTAWVRYGGRDFVVLRTHFLEAGDYIAREEEPS